MSKYTEKEIPFSNQMYKKGTLPKKGSFSSILFSQYTSSITIFPSKIPHLLSEGISLSSIDLSLDPFYYRLSQQERIFPFREKLMWQFGDSHFLRLCECMSVLLIPTFWSSEVMMWLDLGVIHTIVHSMIVPSPMPTLSSYILTMPAMKSLHLWAFVYNTCMSVLWKRG
jgi:hypothetical protein